MRIARSVALPETYAALLAVWYLVLLTLGIPSLPPVGHVLGALTFVGCVAGAGVAAFRLGDARRRRSVVLLAAGFLLGAAGTSLVTATTDLTVKVLMKRTLVGRAVLAVVGACLFVGCVVGAAAVLRAGFDRVAAARAG